MNKVSLDLGLLGRASLDRISENKIEVHGEVPADLELFQDHFPDFPVLPGVMVLDIFKKAAEAAGETANLRTVARAKFSSYLRPGASWECLMERVSDSGSDRIKWKALIRCELEKVASAELIYEVSK